MKSRSKLEEREKHFSTLLQKNREMDIQLKAKTDEFRAKTEEKEHKLQHLRRQYETTVAQMKELETQQQIVQKRAEMQAIHTQQQQIGMASELNRLQMERKREDEFKEAFRDEFEANMKLRANCEALQKQLGSALDEFRAKTEEKEHKLQHLRRHYETTVAQMKELETQQQIVQKRAEMQAIHTQQQQVGMASELNRLQMKRKREDEFKEAFRDEFEANMKLRANCEALQKQLGSALDDLDVSG